MGIPSTAPPPRVAREDVLETLIRQIDFSPQCERSLRTPNILSFPLIIFKAIQSSRHVLRGVKNEIKDKDWVENQI